MRIHLAAAALLLCTTIPAGAGELLGRERVELTPFYGYRFGGHFNALTGDEREYGIDGAGVYGGLMDINLQAENFKLEVLWSHQKTEVKTPLFELDVLPLEIDHFQGGIMQEVGQPHARFAVSLLLGASRLSSPGLGSETHFSGSLGGSLKLFASPHLGLRLDGRAYGLRVSGGSEALCTGNGTCYFSFTGSYLWQGEFTGGLILAF
jgi:hypothetical protein